VQIYNEQFLYMIGYTVNNAPESGSASVIRKFSTQLGLQAPAYDLVVRNSEQEFFKETLSHRSSQR
jgi:hypothetical protein